MDKMHISQITSRLEKNNLIQREVSPLDQRAKRLKLTLAGIECLKKTLPIVEQHDQDFFERKAN